MAAIAKVRPRRPKRAFRPGLGALGGPPLESRHLPGVAFIGLGSLGPVTFTASTEIPPADGTSPRWVQSTGSGPVGGVRNSSLTNIIRRRMLFTGPGMFTWINQVSLQEKGTVNTTVTASDPGTSVAKIDLWGNHTHQDIVTVFEGPQRVDANFTAPPGTSTLGFVNAQNTEISGAKKSWEVRDENGNFNPNWTVTIDFNLDLAASPPQFMKTAYADITTPQLSIKVGMGSPYVSGGPGIVVKDGSGSVLYSNPTFTSGTYTGHWTVPAVSVQTLAYYSRLMTGPQGDFAVGTTGATQYMSYSFHMTLNI